MFEDGGGEEVLFLLRGRAIVSRREVQVRCLVIIYLYSGVCVWSNTFLFEMNEAKVCDASTIVCLM